jgi:outer membrane lipoprotein SlyB
MGTIKSNRSVTVNQHSQLDENELGLIGGGVAGGVIGGSTGRGHVLPAAIGAVAGAVAGSLIEKKVKQQSGLEYIVELENGDLLTIVQGKGDEFFVGQSVYVIVSPSGGRSRIIVR